MVERKIHNYESIILNDMTLEKEGFDPRLIGYQKKYIWAKCRYCGGPHRIRGANYKKSGSACHKSCRLEEQSKSGSPFSNPEVREKAKNNKTKSVSQEEINKRISKGRKKAQSRVEETNVEKYGVKNPFQSEEIKEKIKDTNLKRYGHTSHTKSDKYKEKIKHILIEKYGTDNVLKDYNIRNKIYKTNISKYGHNNPMKNKDIAQKSKNNFQKTVQNDPNNNYRLINILRGEDFWKKMSTHSLTLKELCNYFEIDYQSTTYRLVQDEFKQKYYKTYHFPFIQQQTELSKTIESFGCDVEFNTRQVITPLELDIYVPEKNIAIEFNGSYWHSEAILDSNLARKKHIEKTNRCKERGIRLIHIFEHTYMDRKNQVLNFLKSALNINSRIVYARKCQITNDDASDFIDKYHIQGKHNGVMRYFNLVYNDEILGTITAGKHHERGGDRGACVLTRMVFKDGVTVTGGASKLFKRMALWVKEEGFSQIISWSDTALTEGKVYPKLGFSLDAEYPPSYFYYDEKNRKYATKQSQRKTNKLRPNGVNIRDWNKTRGFYAIWDCGKKKWTYNI